jgi:SAM-dependent methyltransferase
MTTRTTPTATGRTALSSENLAEDFGPKTPYARRAIQTLYAAQQQCHHPHIAEAFHRWRRLFSATTGHTASATRAGANERFGTFVKSIGLEPDRVESSGVLFAIHTYYAILVKLAAARAAARLDRDGAAPLSVFAPHGGRDARAGFVRLESGEAFRAYGLKNFVDGDFFGWYLTAWNGKIEQSLSELAGRLAQYDPLASAVAPDGAHDLLKDLYHALLPRPIRHDLGEYYTPDWLAERLLRQTLRRDLGDPRRRVLDPSCGSGTFLAILIKHIRRRAKRRGIGPAETLDLILRNVVGLDLNPLAAVAARANYLFALGDLLRHRRGNVEIPVRQTDAILTPRDCPDLHTHENGTVPFRTGEGTSGGLSRFSSDENGTVPFGSATVIELPVFTAFDYVVGNPPWINWESLPDDYRRQTRPLWEHYGLFPHAGMDAILGKGRKDLCMLMTYVALDRYLRHGGRLGFVISQGVFKNSGAARGFRRFRLPDGTPCGPLAVDDMTALAPFAGAATRTALLVAVKGRPVRFPVPYRVWTCRVGQSQRRPTSTSGQWSVASGQRGKGDGSEQFSFRTLEAEPISPDDPQSAWLTGSAAARAAIRRLRGTSEYVAREGANTGGANAVYWVENVAGTLRVPSAKTPAGTLRALHPADGTRSVPATLQVSNVLGRAKNRVPIVRATIETDLLYPLVRTADLGRWSARPAVMILLAQDPQRRVGVCAATMAERYPYTGEYLLRFERLLRRRAAYRRYFTETDPFWTMFNVGPYTLARWKVIWHRMGSRMQAAVCGPWGGKPIVPQETLCFVPAGSKHEAHYLCALLNSAPFDFAVRSYSQRGGKSFASPQILENLRVPRFDKTVRLHRKLADFSMAAHGAVVAGTLRVPSAGENGTVPRGACVPSADDAGAVDRIQREVDRCAAGLWNLSQEELAEIRRSLQ